MRCPLSRGGTVRARGTACMQTGSGRGPVRRVLFEEDCSPIHTERLARPWWAELSLFFAAQFLPNFLVSARLSTQSTPGQKAHSVLNLPSILQASRVTSSSSLPYHLTCTNSEISAVYETVRGQVRGAETHCRQCIHHRKITVPKTSTVLFPSLIR